MAILTVLSDIHDRERLTEETAQQSSGQVAKEAASALTSYFKDNEIGDPKKTEVASKIIDAIPSEMIDDVITIAKEKIGNKNVDPKVYSELEKNNIQVKEGKFDTYGDMIDAFVSDADTSRAGKGIILTILGIVALIEPTPVGEIVTAVLAMLPADKFLKIVFSLSFPLTSIVYWFRKKFRNSNGSQEQNDKKDNTDIMKAKALAV